MGTHKIVGASGEAVAKRALWLAWKACGRPLGMGFLQDRPEATEDEVWDAARNAYDYGGSGVKRSRDGEVMADYVFGRMMQLSLHFTLDTVEYQDETPRSDFQAWCGSFPTYRALVDAAVVQLGVEASAL